MDKGDNLDKGELGDVANNNNNNNNDNNNNDDDGNDDDDDYDDDDDDFNDDTEYYEMNQFEEQDNFRSNIDGESQSVDPEFFDYECLSEEDVINKQENLIKLNKYQQSSIPVTIGGDRGDKLLLNIRITNDDDGGINAASQEIAAATSTTTTPPNNATTSITRKTIAFKIIPNGVDHQAKRCDICMDDKTGMDLNNTANNIISSISNSISNIINNNNNKITNNELVSSDQAHHHHQMSSNDCKLLSLDCNHPYCQRCWSSYIRIQIQQGLSPHIECMSVNCRSRIPDEMIFFLLSNPEDAAIRGKYIKLSITEFVQSHPKFKNCPGRDCSLIIHSLEQDEVDNNQSAKTSTNISKKVTCKSCQTTFCFNCGLPYHAPTDCATIKQWFTKCEDDSETSNYISAHTKACPKCKIVIEKNGGCNHMQCFSCKYNFCWICLSDWESHGSEYYECSRYKGNPEIYDGSTNSKAYEMLKKYLFYFERWDNHAKSLKLEQQTLAKIKQKIQDNVMANKGTWIDWHYLLDAAQLLSKCRYTLQYTYPYAYYLEPGPRKQLFEYQQAQLEAEIENLSWEIERAENTNRGDMENQMSIAEKWRTTLLNDFYR